MQARPRYSVRWKEMVPGHSKAVVVIVRGLGDVSFREVIFYSSEDINRSTLEALITKVEETGAKVESCVFDMGNQGIQRELRIYEGNTEIRNPARPSAPVFLIPDAVHSIKNLRSNLLRYGATFQINGKEVTLTKKDFIRVKLRDAGSGQLAILHKIKRYDEAYNIPHIFHLHLHLVLASGPLS